MIIHPTSGNLASLTQKIPLFQVSAHTQVSPSHLLSEICILCKRRSNANTTQTQKRQTTNTFPVPNPNYPGLCSRREKPHHLEGGQGTPAPGTRVDKHQWRATTPRPQSRPDPGQPPQAAGAGAGARDVRKKPGQVVPSRPRVSRGRAPTPGRPPRLTPPRWAAARPGPGRASCSPDARGRSELTRGGARRARGRSVPSSPPRQGQRPAPLGRREDQKPVGLAPPRHGLVSGSGSRSFRVEKKHHRQRHLNPRHLASDGGAAGTRLLSRGWRRPRLLAGSREGACA